MFIDSHIKQHSSLLSSSTEKVKYVQSWFWLLRRKQPVTFNSFVPSLVLEQAAEACSYTALTVFCEGRTRTYIHGAHTSEWQ